MNKTLFGLFLLTAPFFCGCSEKENNNENPVLIYIKGTNANLIKGRITHTSAGTSDVTLDAKFICSATREVAVDVEAQLSMDNALVAEYNTQHGAACLAAPEGSYRFSHNAKTVIKSGAFQSPDTITLTITQPEKFTAGTYLLPVKLSSLAHQTSSNFKVVYVIIETSTSHFRGTDKVAGTLIDPIGKGWTITADKGYTPAAIFNNNANSYWYIPEFPATAVIDLQSPQKLKGLKLGNTYAIYGIHELSLAWSNDGITWNSLGKETLHSPINENGNGAQFVEFYTPVTAQYLKLIIEKPMETLGVIFNFFSIITE
jgi:hypothetical protein